MSNPKLQQVKEIWKDVIGYEGIYKVSNLGNVASINYRNIKGLFKILTPNLNNHGYPRVSLRNRIIPKPPIDSPPQTKEV